ncbi:PAS domain-containing sensor histidine kinase [Nostoc cycadae]|uniref:histidine kinase n=1 Tax=Nostoc cycadae WK-1 TaxID=1861711 RepID=A0A2H6LMD1_9NOSO|nr:PAS domain-containing sensor histidine kinase [Nostoc cycadae]GBE94372.1 ATPase [Nostoc cycadae WK-1]
MDKLEKLKIALANSQHSQFLKHILSDTIKFIGLMQPEGNLLEINQSALNFCGLTSSDVLGRPLWEARWWHNSSLTQEAIKIAVACAATGESVHYEVEILGAGDRLLTFNFSIKPITNQQGQIIFLILQGQNLPDSPTADDQSAVSLPHHSPEIAESNLRQRQLNEQKLRHNEHRYASLAQMSPVAIFRTDLSGNYLYVNERWCELAGCAAEFSFGQGWRRAIHPDDLALVDQAWRRSVPDLQPLRCEFRFRHSPDKIVWVFCQAVAETQANGAVIGYIGTVIDLNEQQPTQQALEESEARFRIMADTAPVMIWMSGLDQGCTFFNQGWLEFTGRTIVQELGNGWAESVHPEDLARCINIYTTAFDARNSFVMEYRLRRFDGEYRWVLDTGTPRFSQNGVFVGFIGSCIDISDRKQIELSLQERTKELTDLNTVLTQTTAILQKRNQELDQFAYVASHDLKAPLRAIANLSQWLEEDLNGQLPQENQQQLNLLRGRVQRMEGLINGLLEYSRIGRIHTDLCWVNVGELLQEVIDFVSPPATFKIETASNMPILMTKRMPLQQVFTNLIENAIKHHSRLDGQVKISVTDQGSHYKFTIADDGPGIAPEYQQKVFSIFQTLTARDRQENTGIGLAIVKKIVETEGGTINLDSNSGIGSSFHFTWKKQSQE